MTMIIVARLGLLRAVDGGDRAGGGRPDPFALTPLCGLVILSQLLLPLVTWPRSSSMNLRKETPDSFRAERPHVVRRHQLTSKPLAKASRSIARRPRQRSPTAS